jgi:hypothetical protein
MIKIEAPSIASDVNIRIIIWVIAMEPRFDSSDFLYLIAILGWGRSMDFELGFKKMELKKANIPAALSIMLNLRHFYKK